MRYRVDDYAMLVGRDRETQEFVAVVREFPSLSWVAESRVDAAVGLRSLLGDILDDMYSQGEDVPTPQRTPILSDLLPA
jgi:hypothetical protein